jgi:hypothetical protein
VSLLYQSFGCKKDENTLFKMKLNNGFSVKFTDVLAKGFSSVFTEFNEKITIFR